MILTPQQSWVARLGLESPGRRGARRLAGGPSASSCALPSAFPRLWLRPRSWPLSSPGPLVSLLQVCAGEHYYSR